MVLKITKKCLSHIIFFHFEESGLEINTKLILALFFKIQNPMSLTYMFYVYL